MYPAFSSIEICKKNPVLTHSYDDVVSSIASANQLLIAVACHHSALGVLFFLCF